MYMDGVVAYGLVIVVLTCVILAYVGRFAYRHIKEDSAKAERKS
jgi:hypothetical protein